MFNESILTNDQEDFSIQLEPKCPCDTCDIDDSRSCNKEDFKAIVNMTFIGCDWEGHFKGEKYPIDHNNCAENYFFLKAFVIDCAP